jgi:hypothetical protein
MINPNLRRFQFLNLINLNKYQITKGANKTYAVVFVKIANPKLAPKKKAFEKLIFS